MVSRKGALTALCCMMMIDGEVLPGERERFDEMAEALGVPDAVEEVLCACQVMVDGADSEDECFDRLMEGIDAALDEGGDVAERAVVWNLLAIARSDGAYAASEQRLIRHVARTRGVAKDVLLEMEALMEAAAAIGVELEAVQASDLPYAKARARVEALEARLEVVRAAAMAMIADELDPVPSPEPIPERPVDPLAAAAGAMGDAGAGIVDAVGGAGAAVAQTVGDAVAPVLGDMQKGLADAGAAVAGVGKQAADGLADAGSQVADFFGGLFGNKKKGD